MKLKIQNYCITISYKYKSNPTVVDNSCFIIKAAPIDDEKALAIAKILFPYYIDIKIESIENDENTLTYEDYESLHMMVNDKLLYSMKDSKTTYENVSHPIDVRYKKLLEKMTKRMRQFTRGTFG